MLDLLILGPRIHYFWTTAGITMISDALGILTTQYVDRYDLSWYGHGHYTMSRRPVALSLLDRWRSPLFTVVRTSPALYDYTACGFLYTVYHTALHSFGPPKAECRTLSLQLSNCYQDWRKTRLIADNPTNSESATKPSAKIGISSKASVI